MRYRMSVIYGHPITAATRALRFADHETKRNGGSGDENDIRQILPLRCLVALASNNSLTDIVLDCHQKL